MPEDGTTMAVRKTKKEGRTDLPARALYTYTGHDERVKGWKIGSYALCPLTKRRSKRRYQRY